MSSKGILHDIQTKGNYVTYNPHNFSLDCIMPINEQSLLDLGFKFVGKSKDMYRDGCFLHKRKRGYVINKRTPIMETVEQLKGYFKYALGKQL